MLLSLGVVLFVFGAFICTQNTQTKVGPALWIIGTVILISYMISPAKAQHTHQGAVGKFYQNWMMPDNRSASCCHDQDCAPAESRFENGKWYAKLGEVWLEVPSAKIERERDAPDARSHLCARPSGLGKYSVFCFIAPGGG